MTPETIGTAVAGFFIMCLTAYNAVQSAKAKQEAQAAAGNTAKVRATLTTNNGGSHVKDALDRIERRQEDDGKVLRDHIESASRTESHIFNRLEQLERQRRPRLLPFL